MSNCEHVPGDPALIEKIVCEIKSQGAFDQFRRECMADVDTKPAYQNLRQRVESSVASFLSAQQWRPDLNKNQLREKLRRHITESGFLETGVERIVDQVVNPKINTVFLPTIEDISYAYLGIPKPKPSLADCIAAAAAAQPPPTPLQPPPPPPPSHQPPATHPQQQQPPPPPSQSAAGYHLMGGSFSGLGAALFTNGQRLLGVDIPPPGTASTYLPPPLGTADLELEAVSPDSDKTGAGSADSSRTAMDGEDATLVAANNEDGAQTAGKPNVSAGSMHLDELTETATGAQHNATDDFESPDFEPLEGRTSSALSNPGSDRAGGGDEAEDGENSKLSDISGLTSSDSAASNCSGGRRAANESMSPTVTATAEPMETGETEEAAPGSKTNVAAEHDHSTSELSQVSSNSRLSGQTNAGESGSGGDRRRPEVECDEAQMPRFNENSSNSHNANAPTAVTLRCGAAVPSGSRPASFADINQDEITFEGTRRHSICVDVKAEAAAEEFAAAAAAAAAAVKSCAVAPPLPPLPPPTSLPPPPPADPADCLLPSRLLSVPAEVPSQMVQLGGGGGGNNNGTMGNYKSDATPQSHSSCSTSSSSAASSGSASQLIIAETRSLTLNDADDDEEQLAGAVAAGGVAHLPTEDVCSRDTKTQLLDEVDDPPEAAVQPSDTAVDAAIAATNVEDFKFETPAVEATGSQNSHDNRSRDSTQKSRSSRDARSSHTSRSSSSSSSSRSKSQHADRKSSATETGDTKDKDRESGGGSSKHRRTASSSSSSRGASSGSSSHHHHHRDKDKDKSKPSKDTKDPSGHRSTSSTRPHHSSSRSSSASASRHHHHSASKDGPDRSRPASTKSSSSQRKADTCNPQRSIERRRSSDQDSNDDQATAPVPPAASDAAAVVATQAASAAPAQPTATSSSTSNTSGSQSADSAGSVRPETAEDFVLPAPPSLPVLVDQILTGDQPSDHDLERLLVALSCDHPASGDPVLSSIQAALDQRTRAALKRPKVASNIHEARKLIKVRKQMELAEQRRTEQALQLAKQYLRTNAKVASSLGLSLVAGGGQGVELEFACVTRARNAAPSISSPVKVGTAGSDAGLTATATAAAADGSATDEGDEDHAMDAADLTMTEDDEDFIGFIEADAADFCGFSADDLQVMAATVALVRHANEVCAAAEQPGSAVHLLVRVAEGNHVLRQLVSAQMWLSPDGVAVGNRPVPQPSRLNQWLDASLPAASTVPLARSPDSQARALRVRRPKSQSESNVLGALRKRARDVQTEALAEEEDAPRMRRIKIDARFHVLSATGEEAAAGSGGGGDSSSAVSANSEMEEEEGEEEEVEQQQQQQMMMEVDTVSTADESVGGDGGAMHVSPTPSELSGVSLKENEVGRPKRRRSVSRSLGTSNRLEAMSARTAAAEATDASAAMLLGRRGAAAVTPKLVVQSTASADVSAVSPQQPLAAVQKKNTAASSKASQQRYTSDDLYKPRPILLGSRSRRRGVLDPEDI